MITEEEFLKAIETVNNYKKQVYLKLDRMKAALEDKKFTHLILDENTYIYDAGLCAKITNIMKQNNINKLGDLKNYTRADLRNFRHIGKKGIDEIEQCLLQAGIVLI